MKSSRKRKVTAAFFAAAALGGVAHAAPTLNMNDLVGSNTTAESTTQATTNVAAPVVRPVVTQPTPTITSNTYTGSTNGPSPNCIATNGANANTTVDANANS